MAILKQRLSKRMPDGSLTPVHLETSSDLVLRPDGTTAEANFISILDEVKTLSQKPTTPEAHAASHKTGGTDPITPASIGAATTTSLTNITTALRNEIEQAKTAVYDTIKSNRATVVIGTSTNGHSADMCDYLCDGEADEVEISKAISKAQSADNGIIMFLPGTYKLASQVTISPKIFKSLTIMGLGAKSVVITSEYTHSNALVEVTYHNRTLYTYNGKEASSAAIKVVGTSYYAKVTFMNIKLTAGDAIGIYANNCDLTIDSCEIVGAGAGLYYDQLGGRANKKGYLKVHNSAVDASWVDVDGGSTIMGSIVAVGGLPSGYAGYVDLDSFSISKVADYNTDHMSVFINDCTGERVVLVSVEGAVVCGSNYNSISMLEGAHCCQIVGCTCNSIFICDAFNNIVAGSRINSYTSGIHGLSAGNVIVGNVITCSYNFPFELKNSAQYNIVTNNVCGTGSIKNSAGSTNIIQDNCTLPGK